MTLAQLGRGLHHADKLVAERRDYDPHRLRQDDPAQRAQPPHPDRLRGLILPDIDRQHARPHHLGRIAHPD